MVNEILDKEIKLIKWLIPFLNDKGKDKYNFILNQLTIIKTKQLGVPIA